MSTLSTTSTTSVPPLQGESAYRGPCRVLGDHVTRITRGGTALIICGEYCETGGICLLRQAALESGPSQELGQASAGSGVPGVSCVMLMA